MILFLTDSFLGAALNHITALLFFTVVCTLFFLFRDHSMHSFFIILSIIISYCAIAAQILKIEIHPYYCSYNATFHCLQALGLFFFYKGMKSIILHTESANSNSTNNNNNNNSSLLNSIKTK